MSMPADALPTEPTLATLLDGIAAAPPLPIAGIGSDSRRLRAGDVFLACRGARTHGLDYVTEAVQRGVAAVVWEPGPAHRFSPPPGIVSVPVSGLGSRLGEIANRWFGYPSRAVRVCGVTGTNGKTTVAWLMTQCLQLAGRPCGYIGTLGAGMHELADEAGLTTPDCIELQRLLAGFRDDGARHAAVEVSSHALLQGRVDGTQFDAAMFTNLSRDHIDYHGDMASYGEAKARLFLDCAPRERIVCVDSDFGTELVRRCGGNAIAVATRTDRPRPGGRYVHVTAADATADGTSLRIDSTWGKGRLRLPLYGEFNIANAAEVLALLLCYDIEFKLALELVACVEAPPGRMQRVAAGAAGPQVFVDFAHTPAALEAALSALRPHCRGELWCVFGCGGDRDRGKRPQMGDIAGRLADRPVVTSDNPRSEVPAAILDDILAGMSPGVPAIEDRAAAIAWAIAEAGADDVVLIAGKGHENYQLVGERRIDFSDYRAAEANLAARRRRQADR